MATKKTTKKKKRNPVRNVTASVAVLSALGAGADTIASIAKGTRMTTPAVQQTLMRLRKKEHARRTNKKGVGVIAKYKITRAGRTALNRAMKDLGVK